MIDRQRDGLLNTEDVAGEAQSSGLQEECSSDEHVEQDLTQQAADFLSEVVRTVDHDIIQPTPPVSGRAKKPTRSTQLRQSRRITRAGNCGPALQRAQVVLMRKLGVLEEQENLTNEAREAYVRLFEHPLSRTHLAALAALLGWTVPEDAEARSADLLVR